MPRRCCMPMCARWPTATRHTYGTRGTPTSDALATAINELGGLGGHPIVPSGLAAVVLPLLAYLSAGDHALIVDSVYFPTRKFANTMLRRLGVEVEYYDPLIGAGIAGLMNPTPNWCSRIRPAPAPTRCKTSRRSPRRRTPAAPLSSWTIPGRRRSTSRRSITASTSSCTPRPNTPPAIPTSCSARCRRMPPAGPSFGRPSTRSASPPGPTMSTRCCAAWHYGRQARTPPAKRAGIGTLAGDQGRGRPCAAPGVRELSGHVIWKRDFSGSSGIFSIVLDGAGEQQSHAFLDALKIFGLRYPWGGYENLAVPVNVRDRVVAKGPYGGAIIRLQIGLEDVPDLMADIERGLAAAAAGG